MTGPPTHLPPSFLQNCVTLTDIQVTHMVLINALHPGKKKKKRKGVSTLTASLHSRIQLSVFQGGSLCADPHSLVSSTTAVLLAGGYPACRDASRALGHFGLPNYGSELWAQRWTLEQETPLTCPLTPHSHPTIFCGFSCTFLSSECVNLYTWCEKFLY